MDPSPVEYPRLSGLYEQPDILPNFPLFSRLIGYAHRFPSTKIAIRDNVTGQVANHLKLLNDVLSVRNRLWATIEEETRLALANGEEVFMMLVAPPGYDYAVGFLAILALGAVITPMSPDAPLQEAMYFVAKSTARGIIYDRRAEVLGKTITKEARAQASTFFFALNISESLADRQLPAEDIYISSRYSLDPTKAGLTIFTSGTTGPPKASVLPREMLSSGTQSVVDHYSLVPSDVTYNTMPLHHIAGITVCFVPFLLAGSTLEIEPFDVERVWERWRKGGLTVFKGVPTMYMRLMRHYEDVIRLKPNCEEYLRGVRAHRFMSCGTSAMPRPSRIKWTKLVGKRIIERYGTSEFSSGITTPLENNDVVPDGSVGVIVPGCDIKIGPEGEMLVKTPGLFLRYHQDEAATAAAFDADGYYRTGDIGRREGKYWFITGRASIDIIKSGGYKISALDIEREILGLDYVAEVAVVGVDDEEFGQRVAAIVVMRDLNQGLELSKLRDDLRSVLSSYKIPSVLYLAKELVKTSSGKVQKKALRKTIFESGEFDGDIQMSRPAARSTRL